MPLPVQVYVISIACFYNYNPWLGTIFVIDANDFWSDRKRFGCFLQDFVKSCHDKLGNDTILASLDSLFVLFQSAICFIRYVVTLTSLRDEMIASRLDDLHYSFTSTAKSHYSSWKPPQKPTDDEFINGLSKPARNIQESTLTRNNEAIICCSIGYLMHAIPL